MVPFVKPALSRYTTNRAERPGFFLESRSALHSPRRALTAILIVFTLLALAFNALTPLGEAPDEVSHFSYVRHVAATWRLPKPQGSVFGEVFQPPLYYFLAAPLTAWQAPGPLPVEANADWALNDPLRRFNVLIHLSESRWPWEGETLAWHLARLLSTLFGLVTVLATAGVAHRTFPNRPWITVAAATFTAFLPQFAFLSGVLNNDALATALGALLLWQLARLLTDDGQGWRGWALLGLLGGLGVWAKTSGWVFLGTVSVGALLAARQAGGLAWPRTAAPLAATWAVVAAPWLLWNWSEYGDPLGWGLMRQVTDARTTPLTLREAWEVARGAYRSFWAGFGGAAHLHFPPLVQGLTAALLALAGIGLARLWRRRATLPAATRRLAPLWALHLGLVVLALTQWTRTVLGTGQGRLLFPALPAIAVLLAGGWATLRCPPEACPNRPCERSVALTVGGSMLALAVAAMVLVLRPLIAPPVAPALADVPAVEWRFGDTLRLERYAFPWTVDSHLPPGSSAELYVAWGTPEALPDLRLRLQLVDRKSRPVWIKDGTPSAGRDTTDRWAAGTSNYPAWHRVTIPSGTPPGWYRLMLSVHPAGDPAPLPITNPAGTFLGDQVMVGQVTVTEAAP